MLYIQSDDSHDIHKFTMEANFNPANICGSMKPYKATVEDRSKRPFRPEQGIKSFSDDLGTDIWRGSVPGTSILRKSL